MKNHYEYVTQQNKDIEELKKEILESRYQNNKLKKELKDFSDGKISTPSLKEMNLLKQTTLMSVNIMSQKQ